MGDSKAVVGFTIFILVFTMLIPLASLNSNGNYVAQVEVTDKICSDLIEPLSKGEENIGLIVQFKDGPRSTDRSFVRDLGFDIKRSFHVVPALSIFGPTSKLDSLLKNNRVTFVEHNDPVVIDMEMGTWVINATQVWSNMVQRDSELEAPIDGTGVTVCVVDTGIDAGHPDLDYQTKTVMNVFDVGGGLWLESENTDTNYGHGTHVAGTVAGNGDASAGARRGVAPGANLIGVTVSIPEEASTPTEDGYVQGLEWVYDHSHPDSNTHNIRCVTNSWHSTVGEYDPNSILTQVIEKLTFENNVVSTWSAGNDGRDDPNGETITTSGQGNTPIAIVCAAYERDGSAVTDFSSRGQVGLNHTYPDVGAPGRSIWSTSARRTVISGGTYIGGNTNPYYLAISGTSMSTPHVAGLVALLWQAAPSMQISSLHEDYSGPDPEGWYANPMTVIHEVEWILEASAILLPRDSEHGNVAGDTNSTGWDGKPIDYVQGYGIVDAKRAVGIALTLERLREKFPDKTVTVRDAIAAYDRDNVDSSILVSVPGGNVQWAGEYSRYNDQSGNPLSLVNQTKYLVVPDGATRAVVSMTYSVVDMSEFKAADLAFTIDFNGDGTADHQSPLSVTSAGSDTADLEVSQPGRWMFNVIGMGIRIPRPFQDINYVELRIEYDISVLFYFSDNGSSNRTIGNAYYANIFPTPDSGEGTYELEVGQFDLRDVTIVEEIPPPPEKEEEFPWWIVGVIIVLLIVLILYGYWKRKKE
jgi:serine protease AprX